VGMKDRVSDVKDCEDAVVEGGEMGRLERVLVLSLYRNDES